MWKSRVPVRCCHRSSATGRRVGVDLPLSSRGHYRMKPPHWLKASVAGAMVVPLVVVVSATPSAAQPPVEFTAQALTPSEHLSVAKAPTSRLARTDKSLL